MQLSLSATFFRLSIEIENMKKLAITLLLGGLFLSCEKNTTEDCKDKICTEEFRMLTIRFVDKQAQAVEVKDLNVVNQRTGERVYANSSTSANLIKGSYIFVDDGNTKSLSASGDDLKITGTSLTTNQVKSAIVKVKGGECACHIEKVAGPEQITFD